MSTNLRSSAGLLAIGALGLILLSCNSGQQPPSAASGNANAITGAGSTFIYPMMTQWIESFRRSHPEVHINYQSIGSGGGIQQLKSGLVDFGASDAALDDQQLREMRSIVQIPESAGPVCITYNLPDLHSPLRLSGTTLASIYLGKIKTWHDPAIAKDNPGVSLPNDNVVVAHRSEGSGTTNIFTTYLAKVSPEWENRAGKGLSISWPTGVGGKGSEGVTGVVKQTAGGIGYVELAYAKQNNLPVATVRNRAGKWVEPSAAGTTAAIQAFSRELAQDVRTPIVDPPATAEDAYPISGLTFLLIPKEGKNPAKTQILKDFAEYVITQGQDLAEHLSYAKLPETLQKADQNLLAQVGTHGENKRAAASPPRQ